MDLMKRGQSSSTSSAGVSEKMKRGGVWSKSKGKTRQRDEVTEVAPSKSKRATPTKVLAEVVGVSVPDTPEGVRDLAATNPGDSSPGAQREQ